jgi:hypothetical protein
MPVDARSPAEKSLQARRAVYTSWANTSDRTARTAAARRARLERLADRIDPKHELSDEERDVRARALRKAELLEFAERSAKARRKAKSRNENGARRDAGAVQTDSGSTAPDGQRT